MIIDNAIISITKVNLSSDIKLANVHISIFTSNAINPSDILDQIIKDKKEIKYKMGLLLNQITDEHESLENGLLVVSAPKDDLIGRMDVDYDIPHYVN